VQFFIQAMFFALCYCYSHAKWTAVVVARLRQRRVLGDHSANHNYSDNLKSQATVSS